MSDFLDFLLRRKYPAEQEKKTNNLEIPLPKFTGEPQPTQIIPTTTPAASSITQPTNNIVYVNTPKAEINPDELIAAIAGTEQAYCVRCKATVAFTRQSETILQTTRGLKLKVIGIGACNHSICKLTSVKTQKESTVNPNESNKVI